MKSKIEYIVNNKSKLVEKLIMLEDRNNSQFNKESYYTWKELAEECSNSGDITMFANGYEEGLTDSSKLDETYKHLNNSDKQIYINEIEKCEDREDLEDIVHEIFFYDKALFAMMNRFPKNASFEELKANKIAILKDSMLTEDYQQNKDEWGEPYSYDEVERELKSITNNWTDKEGTIRCYWEQEKNYGLQILKKYYKYVETSDGRTGKGEDMSWVLAYSKPKEIFDESLNESVTSQLQDKIIDCLDWFILMEMEFPKGKFLADSWEDVKDGIQMGIDPEFEIAEGIVEYLKPIITFNKRYNKEVEEEGVFQDEIEMYQSLVRAMNNYLAKNGYEERIEE